MVAEEEQFMLRAIELAMEGISGEKGGPFGAVVVKDGVIIGEGCNMVTSTNDPTAHAEMVAIRAACAFLGSFQLTGCDIYASCEPCPMCLGAIYWARPARLLFAGTREDAAGAGFDDQMIYDELGSEIDDRKITTLNLMRQETRELFRVWMEKPDKTEY